MDIKEMKGILFKREKRQESSADFGGECVIDGKHYIISAWKNMSKSGNAYLSLSFSKNEPLNKQSPKETKEKFDKNSKFIEDEIPF